MILVNTSDFVIPTFETQFHLDFIIVSPLFIHFQAHVFNPHFVAFDPKIGTKRYTMRYARKTKS